MTLLLIMVAMEIRIILLQKLIVKITVALEVCNYALYYFYRIECFNGMFVVLGCPEGGEPFRESANGQYRACASGGNECPVGYACSQVTLGTSTVYSYCCPTRGN